MKLAVIALAALLAVPAVAHAERGTRFSVSGNFRDSDSAVGFRFSRDWGHRDWGRRDWGHRDWDRRSSVSIGFGFSRGFGGHHFRDEHWRSGWVHHSPVFVSPSIDCWRPVAVCPPVIFRPAPVIVHPAPVIIRPRPVFVHPDPVIFHPRPVVVHPAPVVFQPAPVIVHPAPVIVHPSPVVFHPAPVVVHPRPVLVVPQPDCWAGDSVTFHFSYRR